MNKELTFIVEPDVGRVTVEISKAPTRAIADAQKDLGNASNVNCGRPISQQSNTSASLRDTPKLAPANGDNFSIWLFKLYHNSVVDGPGRRSVVQVAGCSIRCLGCYVPQTHKRENRKLVSITSTGNEIVANRGDHDGVTILGGEPFEQPGPVAELVSRLKGRGFHITVCSGYTLEALIGRKDPRVDYVLTHIDLVIDGPFVAQLGEGAGEYRGSRNQGLIGNATIG